MLFSILNFCTVYYFFQILQSHHSFIAEFDIHSFKPSDLLFLTSGSRSQNQTFSGKEINLCDFGDILRYSFFTGFPETDERKNEKELKNGRGRE